MKPNSLDAKDYTAIVTSTIILLSCIFFHTLCLIRELALSESMARMAYRYQTAVNYLTSFTASILGLLTGFLFSQAVGSALRNRISERGLGFRSYESWISLASVKPHKGNIH